MRKHAYKYVKALIEKDGTKLLSKEYVDSTIKLNVRCPKGHEYNVRINDFKEGARCLTCYHNSLRLTYKDVKAFIEEASYTLLSKRYINGKVKLKFRCPGGHEFSMTFTDFKQGHRCAKCILKVNADKRRHDYEYVKAFIEKDGTELLSKEYIDGNH